MSQNPSCLIVDDEADIRELLVMTLERMNIETFSASGVKDAQQMLAKQQFWLCLTDMQMADGTGLDLLQFINEHHSGLPVAVITAHGSADNAVSALKAGAFDYLSKPISLKQLRPLVESALKLRSKMQQSQPNTLQLYGESEQIKNVRQMIEKLARSQAPVYISGESGSGKELAAKLIHQNSSRAEAPFIAVNCGAIPENLMESEFFGYKKGAFTGASQDKAGMFQAATGGTLFLDEVADLPLAMQVKLLRAIQEKKVRMVGSTAEEAVDVRIISATHKNLSEMMDQGLFRKDLYYRLNVIQLKMPALRERPVDIPIMANMLLEKLCQHQNITLPEIDIKALTYLSTLSFPGNVRELENMLERALALCDGKTITIEDLSLEDFETLSEETPREESLQHSTETSADSIDIRSEEFKLDNLNLTDYLEDIEKKAIIQALQKTNNNKTAAAKLLGVTFRTLRYRLVKLGLSKDGEAETDDRNTE